MKLQHDRRRNGQEVDSTALSAALMDMRHQTVSYVQYINALLNGNIRTIGGSALPTLSDSLNDAEGWDVPQQWAWDRISSSSNGNIYPVLELAHPDPVDASFWSAAARVSTYGTGSRDDTSNSALPGNIRGNVVSTRSGITSSNEDSIADSLRMVENLLRINESGIYVSKDLAQLDGNRVFCPRGSPIPLEVLPGYYSTGGNATTRTDQMKCPRGSYCVNGVIRDCPAGRFGRTERLSSPFCSGLCQRGHYCPTASESRTERLCPIGRYGAVEGLGTPSCSGACANPLDCPAGSVHDRHSRRRIR